MKKDEQGKGDTHLQPLTTAERHSLLKALPADSAPSATAADKTINASDATVGLYWGGGGRRDSTIL